MDKAGYGLIETLRVREGRMPFLERHLARLERSLRELGLPRPSQGIAELVRPFAGTDEAVLRVEVCDGRATVTVRELPARDPPLVITASEPHEPYPHKTTERDRFDDAATEAEVAEADDALLLTHEGWVNNRNRAYPRVRFYWNGNAGQYRSAQARDGHGDLGLYLLHFGDVDGAQARGGLVPQERLAVRGAVTEPDQQRRIAR